jgi:hypothetical protein
MPEPHLRIVEPLPPEVLAMQDTIMGLETTVRKQGYEIGRLSRELREEAESDEVWETAKRLFAYHCKITGHKRAEWTPDRFRLVKRRLKKRNGLEACLRAVAGTMADGWRVEKGLTTWEDTFGGQGKFERALAACPSDWKMPKGADVNR